MNEQIKNEMDDGAKAKREQVLSAIAEELPPVVFRNWHKWRDVLPMAPRTVANDDSIGKGPKEKVFVGRNAGYPKQAFLEYLRKRIHFTEGKSN
jgi:hypothetical protein